MTLSPIYCDHDSSAEALLRELRSAGVDAVAAREVGNTRLDDEQQLAYAAGVGRAIYTANRGHFAELQAQWARAGRSRAGIIIRRNRTGMLVRSSAGCCLSCRTTRRTD
ncbi:MAG: DUF5615 family PIN-like protein [Tepidiformaceae bacterium]